ncbi:putative molybdate ABC transporter, ATP-binding protein [delta proteobacterium NaphS2]|nr:putative molybdate ABC transporter, ATP-binding protein [delta proteobacterium NaphS2]
MAQIGLKDVRNGVIKGISVDILQGELFVMVGPSGAGKTTLLNMIAGLVPYEGHIFIDGACVDKLPTFKRKIGYLFQDLLLFPHMSVARNIFMALKRVAAGKREKGARVSDIMALLNLASLADRLPGTLSGGEQQRVALARALVSSPKVLLLDEPFSNLDFRTARHLRLELKRVQRELKTTMLFVTHNLEEAEELGDRMGVISGGELEQAGEIDEIMLQGKRSQCGFLEKPNVFCCRYEEDLGNGLAHVRWAGKSLFVPQEDGKSFSRVAIHPKDVYVSPHRPPGPPVNRFEGRVERLELSRGMARVTVRVAGERILALMTIEEAEALSLSIEDPVYGILKLRALHGC